MNDTASLQLSGVLPFIIDAGGRPSAMRGRFVRIDQVASSILGRHRYPDAVAELSAEAMALAACLASTMSFDGVFTLQASGSGPIKTLFADVTSDGAMRGYTQHQDDHPAVTAEPGAPSPILRLMGGGYLAFTVDQGEKGRYQGIVPIEEPDLTAVSMRYFFNSEQIDTALLLSARPDGRGGWHAAALMLQRIPEDGGKDGILPMSKDEADHWHTACTLMATCSRDELTDPGLPQETLLFRLFNEMDISVQPFRVLKDECRCSPERVQRMLAGLAPEDIQDLADDDNTIIISCEFCKKEHRHTI